MTFVGFPSRYGICYSASSWTLVLNHVVGGRLCTQVHDRPTRWGSCWCLDGGESCQSSIQQPCCNEASPKQITGEPCQSSMNQMKAVPLQKTLLLWVEKVWPSRGLSKAPLHRRHKLSCLPFKNKRKEVNKGKVEFYREAAGAESKWKLVPKVMLLHDLMCTLRIGLAVFYICVCIIMKRPKATMNVCLNKCCVCFKAWEIYLFLCAYAALLSKEYNDIDEAHCCSDRTVCV